MVEVKAGANHSLLLTPAQISVGLVNLTQALLSFLHLALSNATPGKVTDSSGSKSPNLKESFLSFVLIFCCCLFFTWRQDGHKCQREVGCWGHDQAQIYGFQYFFFSSPLFFSFFSLSSISFSSFIIMIIFCCIYSSQFCLVDRFKVLSCFVSCHICQH